MFHYNPVTLCFLVKRLQSPSVFSHATRSTAEAHIYRSLAAGPSLETPSSSDRLAFHFVGKQYEHGWKWMNLYEHVWTCVNMHECVWAWKKTYWLMRTKGSSKQLVVSGSLGPRRRCSCLYLVRHGKSSVAWLPEAAMVGGWGVQGCPNGCPIQICRYAMVSTMQLTYNCVHGLFIMHLLYVFHEYHINIYHYKLKQWQWHPQKIRPNQFCVRLLRWDLPGAEPGCFQVSMEGYGETDPTITKVQGHSML